MVPSSNEIPRDGAGTTPNERRVEDTATDSCEAIVVYEQNEHGAMTMRSLQTNATFHIVDYASPELRDEADRLERGTRTTLRVSRAGDRGNLWRAEQVSEPSGLPAGVQTVSATAARRNTSEK